MNLYSLSLAIGAIGLLAMALTGLGRHGHAHSHVGGKLGHARGGRHHAHHGTARRTATSWAWSLTSPPVLFTLPVRFGTTGGVGPGVPAPHSAFRARLRRSSSFRTGL